MSDGESEEADEPTSILGSELITRADFDDSEEESSGSE